MKLEWKRKLKFEENIKSFKKVKKWKNDTVISFVT